MEEKELFIPVDQGKLFCRVFGNKKNTPIIVMHGGPGLGQSYLLPQMSEIGKFSFAIFYDQRGTGKSTSDDAWQSDPFKAYVRDVDQLRETFGFKKISLLAHSWGGMLASFYVLAYPEQVDKVIYVNPVPMSSGKYLAFVKHRSQIVDLHKDELTSIKESKAFTEGDPETVEKFYRIYFRNYFAKPELSNQLTLTMDSRAAIHNFQIYNFFYDYVTKNPFDLYEKLTALNKPSLIVACDKDIIPFNYMEDLHRSIHSSKLSLIKNSGHFPYIDQPGILFKIIQDVVESEL